MSRKLDAILEELVAREPLFHHRELADSADTFELDVADDFREVGASGRVYDRDTVKHNLLRRLADNRWFKMPHLGPDSAVECRTKISMSQVASGQRGPV